MASKSGRFGADTTVAGGIVTRASDCTRKVTRQRVAIVRVISCPPLVEQIISSDLPTPRIVTSSIDFVNTEIDFIYIAGFAPRGRVNLTSISHQLILYVACG